MWIGILICLQEQEVSFLFEKLVAFARSTKLLVNDNSFVLNDNPMSLLQVKGAKEVALS
jgi:hypothetical protein